MKKVFTSIILIGIILLVSGCGKTVQNNSNIKNFTYDYGSYNGGYYSYAITREDDQIHLDAKGMNGVDLNADKSITESDLNELAKIINDYKIYEWNGFHKSDKNVLDGYSFSIEIQYSDGEIMEASGYMKYPNNYEKAHEALENYLYSLAK